MKLKTIVDYGIMITTRVTWLPAGRHMGLPPLITDN